MQGRRKRRKRGSCLLLLGFVAARGGDSDKWTRFPLFASASARLAGTAFPCPGAGCSAGVSLHARLEIAAWWPGPDPWLSPVACRFRSSPGCERALLASSTGTRPLQFLSRPLSPLRKKHHTTLLPSARATRIVQQRRPTAPRLPWPFFALSHTLCESSVKGLVEFAVTRVGACALPNERNELDDRMMPLGQSPAKHRLLQAQDPVSP